jgi:hypothetical protein
VLRARRIDEALAIAGAGDVGRHRQRAPSHGPHGLGHLVEHRRGARREHHVGAFPRTRERDLGSQAGPDAGDHDDAIGEQHRHAGR